MSSSSPISATSPSDAPEKSPGHILFVSGFEFYEDAAGDVYRAPLDNVFDCLTGYRIGRWECSRAHFDRFREVILAGFA